MEEPDIRSWPGLSCQFGANCSCARRKTLKRQAITRYSGKSHENKSNSKQAGGRGQRGKGTNYYHRRKRTSSRRCCQIHALPESRHAQYPSLP